MKQSFVRNASWWEQGTQIVGLIEAQSTKLSLIVFRAYIATEHFPVDFMPPPGRSTHTTIVDPRGGQLFKNTEPL